MPLKKGIRTLALSVPNPQEAETFYTKVMGGKVVNRIERPIKGGRMLRETFIELGDLQVALVMHRKGRWMGFPTSPFPLTTSPKKSCWRNWSP